MELQVENSKGFTPYHNGNGYYSYNAKSKIPLTDREVIAWDMEGMNLSGAGKPQHAVLFGCSKEKHAPLIGKNLQSMQMLEYIIQVGKQNPSALHVGYGFKYDANMLIKNLSHKQIRLLWTNNHVRLRDRNGNDWSISCLPGKRFTVTKWFGRKPKTHRKSKDKVTVTIYDYSSFFGGQKFLDACEKILKEDLTEEDKVVVEHGKLERHANTWDDLQDVCFYWEAEISLIQKTFERFRNVMHQAGFSLKEWYGPGALANYINAVHKIKPHLVGAQYASGSMPKEVHEASKVAFSGGRFELYSAGRQTGPVYSIDINSAYPHALTMIPSLSPNHGEWRHVENPRKVSRFGFYRISFAAPDTRMFDSRAMPLFHRDRRGLICYPGNVHGWYASPEARMVLGMAGVQIHEGWEWVSSENEFPWEFLRNMYETRMRLGKSNLLSMPFKLGPNSLYGKYAQTVGWDKKTRSPPRSHALPIAAWVTSYCRSMLWSVIRQVPDKVIAVETDSVFLTVDPKELDIDVGDQLGQWGITEYDELLYLQSGMYHYKQDGEWRGTRSRGIHATEYPFDMAREYIQQLKPGTEWEPLKITTKPRFIGAGAAMAANDGMAQHCAWISQEREIKFGLTGKRRHVAKGCKSCEEGHTPWEQPHRLAVVTPPDFDPESKPRTLPWESEHPEHVQKLRDDHERDKELIADK